MTLAPLHQLAPATQRNLAASLRSGPLSAGLSQHSLVQLLGPAAAAVQRCIEDLRAQGMTLSHVAILLEALAGSGRDGADALPDLELVLSGPEVPGVPTADTGATVQTLIEGAQQEILLVGYAVHNGRQIFRRLAERLDAVSALRCRFCLDIPRKLSDTSLASEIVLRFARDFLTKHWPGSRLPEVFYDPRALADSPVERAALHAKCVLVDGKIALVTSANFTDAAHRKNIEVGVLVRERSFVERLVAYFDKSIAMGRFVPCNLRQHRPRSGET
jgi:hypothetical protein